uniref:VWFA domain-containing protein n=1 Tax=Leptobrachium leishanense TaxID=445787 RepID=A0A8C5PI54_9ANUR
VNKQKILSSADLVFLIDGSNKVGARNFSLLRDFLVNFVQRHLDIGRRDIQVAVVQYSDDVKVEFALNVHSSKAQLTAALRNLRLLGGEESNLGAAIQHVLENIFTAAAGSRREEGVPQSLVIISAGPSSDEFRDASNDLKINRIITFGIAVEGADTPELQQIASDGSFVFVSRQFQSLGDLDSQLVPYIAGVNFSGTNHQEMSTTLSHWIINLRKIL